MEDTEIPVENASETPSARSLVLDLLSTLRRGAMPVRALIEAAALFGIAEGSVRVALTRLCGDGRVERDERGRYRIGAAARPLQAHVGAWRSLGARLGPWSGAWIGVLGATPAAANSRAAQRRSTRALLLLGFRPLARGLAVRPDNLAGGAPRVREELAALGLAPGALLATLDDLDAVTEARARGLWDGAGLMAGYRGLRTALAASARRLRARPPEEAMVETFRVGGEVLRALSRDPLLPEPIVPAAERDALVEAMRAYDAFGRASWAAFLARHGVPHSRAPVDTRSIARGGIA